MTKISTGDFQKGIFIEFRGEPHQLVNFEFYNPGKGSAVVRSRLKNLKTKRVTDFTFKSGEDYVFMNQTNFEQLNINKEMLGNFAKFLKEGDICQVIIHESEPLGLRPPKKVRLKVMEADEGAKGNTVSGAKKSVKLETGVVIMVPLFINDGDIVVVDTETGEYVERSK